MMSFITRNLSAFNLGENLSSGHWHHLAQNILQCSPEEHLTVTTVHTKVLKYAILDELMLRFDVKISTKCKIEMALTMYL